VKVIAKVIASLMAASASQPCLAFSLQLDADRLVIPSTGSKTPYSKIHYLQIMDGAPANIFDSPPIQFPNVKIIGLSAPLYIDYHLKYLAKNYAWLGRLSLDQKESLPDKDFEQLKHFRFHSLDFDCPIESPKRFMDIIPKTLKLLYLGPYNNITERSDVFLSLPNLSKLDIRATKLNNDFLTNSSLPNLKRLDLTNVRIEGGRLNSLEKFPKLKTMDIFGTSLDESTMQVIKARKIKIIKYPTNLPSADTVPIKENHTIELKINDEEKDLAIPYQIRSR